MTKDSNVYKYFKNKNDFYKTIKKFLVDNDYNDPRVLINKLHLYLDSSIETNNIILQAFNSLIEKKESTE